MNLGRAGPPSVSNPTIPIFTSNFMLFTEHLRHRDWYKDLNKFADRISKLQESLISLLSQQAEQQPGKHTDVLTKLASHLAKNRAFYATIMDKTEQIAVASISKQSKQGGDVSLNYLSAGFLGFLWLLGQGWPRYFKH